MLAVRGLHQGYESRSIQLPRGSDGERKRWANEAPSERLLVRKSHLRGGVRPEKKAACQSKRP
jgi:hypothetical protein